MKHLNRLAALTAAFATVASHAAPFQASGTQTPWGLYTGTGTGSRISSHPTFDACVQAAAAIATKAGTATCKPPPGNVQVTATPAPPPSTWTKIADENAQFKLLVATTVRYGIGTGVRIQKNFSPGTFLCSNGVFGGDPSPGIEKECDAAGGAPAPAPAPGPAPAPAPTPAPSPAPTPAPAPAPSGPLSATRVSGPAPLAVQVDASGMGAFNGVYSFDFGDDRGLRWAVSGQPKNTQSGGALAAHVYDLPGTYTVRVGTASLTITVQDPNTVYAGSATICVSPAANYSGCPGGAAQQTALPSSYAGKRVLLHRGETFDSVSPRNTDSGFQVGAYGTGAKPVVAGVFAGMAYGVASWANDWTVMDLAIGSGDVNIDATTSRFLLYRNDIKTPGGNQAMVNIGTAAGYYQSHNTGAVPGAINWPREVFLVENDIQGVVQADARPNLVVMGYFLRSAILGNTMDRATEHTLRVWAASKLVIAHNTMGGNHYAPSPPGIRSALKMHSGGAQTFTDLIAGSTNPATSQVVIANNVLGSSTYPGSWLSGMGPQNADPGTVEGLEDCIAENNVFVHGPYTSSDMQIRGRRMTARGNTVQGGGRPDIVRNGSTFDAGMAVWDGPYFLQ